jgi:hypothetical protein
VTITAKPGVKLEIPDGTVIENKVYFLKRHTLVDLKNFAVLKQADALVFLCLMFIRIYITFRVILKGRTVTCLC